MGSRGRKSTINWFPLERIPELESAMVIELDHSRSTRRRDGLACSFGLCGLRSGEVSGLTVGDMNVPLRRLFVRTLKGGPERTIEMDSSVVNEVLGWRQGRFEFAKPARDDLLLPNCRGGQVRREMFNDMAKRIFGRLLGEGHGLTFHSLRHTFAMRTYNETQDLFLTQQLLGHSSVATTEIYARSLATLPESCRPKLLRDAEFAERFGVVGA